MTIEGYSRAAYQTFWRIPEYKLGFDLGAQPWSFMGTPNWFVSHTHMDHLLALPAYVARRKMMKMSPPNIFLPDESVEPVKQLLWAFTRLDRGHLPCKLVGLKPGDEVELSRELVVSAQKTFHSLPSLGYIVWERRNKLKEEYQAYTQDQIRDLSLSGVKVSQEIRFPRIAYLGDSTIRGLDMNPQFYEADVLIFEMTFVLPEHRQESLQKFGHIHLDDIRERRKQFKNQLLIASHFSTRYNNHEIERLVRQNFPDMLNGRLMLWI
ncbi:MAG: MBL fold metallo-hydrolase [Thermoguttaceae bacterium]